MSRPTRRSAVAISTTETLPPWVLANTSLRTPARRTLSPISVSARIRAPAESDKVPGNARCSSDVPIGSIGRKLTGSSPGSNSRAPARKGRQHGEPAGWGPAGEILPGHLDPVALGQHRFFHDCRHQLAQLVYG